MNEIKTEYNGYPIDYNESTERFRAIVDGNIAFESPSLKALKEQIDKFEKAQKNKEFKRFKVLVLQDNWEETYNFAVGEVTSITDDKKYWISVNNKRQKESSIIPLTEASKQITDKIVALKNEEKRLNEERYELYNTLIQLKDGARPQE